MLPDEFKAYETIAYAKGFLMVSASPLTRSSHHAGDDFARLKAARAASGLIIKCATCWSSAAPGSGKSTFAGALSPRSSACRFDSSRSVPLAARLGISRHGTPRAKSSRALADKPEWVMDGNYAETFDLRMPRADTLVWLDYPRATCVRARPDADHQGLWRSQAGFARGCPEQFDREIAALGLDFPAEERPLIAAASSDIDGHLRRHPASHSDRERGALPARVAKAG